MKPRPDNHTIVILTTVRFLPTAALVLALALFSACATLHFGPDARHPNILCLTTDDLRAADLACYGGALAETPHLDRLAADGMCFTQAYASSPAATPSWAAFLTGKYPARLGITDAVGAHRPAASTAPGFREPASKTNLPREAVTVARVLGAAGYEPGLLGTWEMSVSPLPLGFDSYQPDSKAIVSPAERDPARNDGLTAVAEKFLAENGHRANPFFLCVRYHAAGAPKPGLVRRYAEKTGGDAAAAARAARIADLDANVGRLLARLDALKLRDRTIVVFTSNNGAPVTAGPLREATLRVPLLVRWPGVAAAGASSDALVSSVDLAPTLLDAAGLTAPPSPKFPDRAASEPAADEYAPPPVPGLGTTDGQSFADILRGVPAPAPRQPVFWHYPHATVGAPAGAVRSGDWKFVESFAPARTALYSLAGDPGEATDLAAAQPEKVAELRDQLDRWRAAVGAHMPPAAQPAK